MEKQAEGYCELADLDAAMFGEASRALWTRGLLVRRTIADGALAYFSTGCPHGTDMETLVKVEGQRWPVEDDFETGKNEFGLDHNETRSWHGWHRHVPLSMLALAMMAAVRREANLVEHQKNFRSWRGDSRPDLLVGPGDPSSCHAASSATDHSSPRHRLVMLEACSSSSRSARSPQEIATVVPVLLRTPSRDTEAADQTPIVHDQVLKFPHAPLPDSRGKNS